MSEWDRQEGEPTKWYNRFERYRLMGSNRSVLATYHGESAKSGNGRQKGLTPGSWSTNADKWNWKARAEAWDMQEAQSRAAAAALQQAKEEAEKERERREWRLKRKQLAQGLFAKAATALNSVGGENPIANLNQVANTVKIVLGELRAEFDDMPTQRGVTWNLDPESLADKSESELEALRKAIAKGEQFSSALLFS